MQEGREAAKALSHTRKDGGDADWARAFRWWIQCVKRRITQTWQAAKARGVASKCEGKGHCFHCDYSHTSIHFTL